jgi:hypothetical protein
MLVVAVVFVCAEAHAQFGVVLGQDGLLAKDGPLTGDYRRVYG